MSATFLFPQRDAVHLLSDGGGFDLDGRLLCISSKVATFPEFSMAVGYQGRCNPHFIWNAMAAVAPTSEQEAFRALPEILSGIVKRNRAEGSPEPDVLLMAATWHAKLGSAAWLFSSKTENMPAGYQPCEPLRLRAYLDAVGDPATILGRAPDLTDPTDFDPATDGLRLMEAARHTPDDKGRNIVAGFAEIVSISAAGLTRRTLAEWKGDQVGALVNPARKASASRAPFLSQLCRSAVRASA